MQRKSILPANFHNDLFLKNFQLAIFHSAFIHSKSIKVGANILSVFSQMHLTIINHKNWVLIIKRREPLKCYSLRKTACLSKHSTCQSNSTACFTHLFSGKLPITSFYWLLLLFWCEQTFTKVLNRKTTSKQNNNTSFYFIHVQNGFQDSFFCCTHFVALRISALRINNNRFFASTMHFEFCLHRFRRLR